MNPLLAQLKSATVSNPLRRALNVTAKVISEQDGTVEFVASDETLDCYREIVRVNGWRFTHFAKNAPFVDSHDYSSITKLLGQVTDWRIEKGQLVEVVKYSREPGTLAEWAFKMVRDGFLRAVSVGFVPVSMVSKWDQDQKDFLATIADLKLDAQLAGQVRVIYREQEQIELSQCVIGANPNALAKAYKAGCLTEEDIDNFSAIIAATKNASPAADSADAGEASPRTKLAILAEIQRHLI
jgi:hypothetical protein